MLYLIHCFYLKGYSGEKRYAIYNDKTETLKYSNLGVVRELLKSEPICGLELNSLKNLRVTEVHYKHEDIYYDIDSNCVVLNKPIKIINMPKDFIGVFRDLNITRESGTSNIYIRKKVFFELNNYDFCTFLQNCNLFIRRNSSRVIVVLPVNYVKTDCIYISDLFKDLTENNKVIISSDIMYNDFGKILDFGNTNLRSFKGFSHLFENYKPHIIDFSMCLYDITSTDTKDSRYFFNPIIHDYVIYIFNKKQINLIKRLTQRTGMTYLGNVSKTNRYDNANKFLSKYILLKNNVTTRSFYVTVT